VRTFVPTAPVMIGIDETIERRRGEQIAAKGIYRDPVRSSHTHFVKASGLRWVSLMLLAPIPWTTRVWGLPFLTVLSPSSAIISTAAVPHEPCWTVHGKPCGWYVTGCRSKNWSWWTTLPMPRWSGSIRSVMPCVSSTRLRLDAALYEPAPPRQPRQNGRPRKKGRRVPTLEKVLAGSTTPWTTVTVANWTAKETGGSRSPRIRLSGITRGSPSCPSDGS
jgi:hypothetical protein